MRETHVISALVEKRARLMGEVNNRRFQILRIEAEIGHVDAVIKMFRPATLWRRSFRRKFCARMQHLAVLDGEGVSCPISSTQTHRSAGIDLSNGPKDPAYEEVVDGSNI